MPEERWVDWQSILIHKDKEKKEYVDYFFICEVYGKDPRHEKRNMKIGQTIGLFRIDKTTLEPKLLRSVEGDLENKRFFSAAFKVLREYQSQNIFPDKAHLALG